ncbi:MAG: citrate synthase [Atopobiaceae bacterium]|nr:citrate synthase [Atopobiaceae bacterium]
MRDVYPMPSEALGLPDASRQLYEGFNSVDSVPDKSYVKYDVKRGLRNADGSGVLVGLTTVSNVHGYMNTKAGVIPDDGSLALRGYDMATLVRGAQEEKRFGYEEIAYLLLSGKLPNKEELEDFEARLNSRRQLPEGYLHVFPRTNATHSIMNILQRSTLLMYSFDKTPDDTSPIHEIDVAITLLARLPRIAAIAQAAITASINGERLAIPPVRERCSMAESVLDVLRGSQGFTHDEALLLDVMLMLHAEHGGGNNSTFACRVLSSSGTDAYSAYAAAIGSLKGPKHGGANYKVGEMFADIEHNVRDWNDDDEIAAYLSRILRKEVFDKAGLIYGMGHAVYTKSDPRAQIVKRYARSLAQKRGIADELDLIESVERLAPRVMRDVRGIKKTVSANIDMYTGFVYSMLGVPQEMYTPIFAIARMAGWAAHRMEELYGANRIIRPAYRSILTSQGYKPLDERE